MARKSSLDVVYAAIHELRASKEPVNPTTVSQKSGLRRSTLYQSDKDWIAVLEMIEGDRPVPLPSSVVPKIPPTTTRRYSKLSNRISEMEKRVVEMRELVDSTHKLMLERLLSYISLSRSHPGQKDELSKLRRELGIYEQQYRELKVEHKELAARTQASRIVPMKGVKRVLVIPSSVLEVQLLSYFSGLIERAFESRDVFEHVTTAILVCGLPHAGKSTWTAAQSSTATGITLYVEGSFHTTALRKSVAAELRRRGVPKIGCTWISTPSNVCLDRAFLADDDDAIPDLIDRLASDLEIVSIMEDFDFISGVRHE